MKLRILKFVPLLLSALLFAGCESIPGMSDDEAAGSEAAPVTESGEGGQGSTMSAAEERPAWSGSPLENPESPLYTKVIYFDYDVDQVRSDYYQVVVAHGEYLATNPAITVTLEGHADERGSREYNIALGERRANSVRQILLAQGVSDSQIITISYGEERPAVTGGNEASWSQNRRAVFAY
ncbi:MAG: peptidoglycan-associated lipoprotein Pal [Candidatus Sedimenticola sp. (ex Thyasira tokunagai)]